MVKREETDKSNDGYHYFTVVNPYPLNANMEIAGDKYQFAQWLAAITGNPGVLMAFYHKPSAPRSVLLQVAPEFTDHRRILGKHVWGGNNGFLRSPPRAITEQNYSAIYYCHYVSNAGPSEHGWKIVDFEDYMFGSPGLRQKVFKNPYPTTLWIQAPSGDAISVHLCRNLPVALFGTTEDQTKPSVSAPAGSSTWGALKTTRMVPAPNKRVVVDRKQEPESPSKPDFPVKPEPEDMAPDGEPLNLWGPHSDLPYMSLDGYNEEDVCPNHGTTCKKMCDWRVAREKAKGPKSEGPSNVKNYRSKLNSNDRKGPSAKNSHRAGSSATASAATSPNRSRSTSISTASSPTKPSSVKPTRNGRSHGVTPVLNAAEGSSTPTSPLPSSSTPEIVNAGSPSLTARRGVPTGAVRGAPAWASRGRGRGRGVY